jgi:hypothetical protein
LPKWQIFQRFLKLKLCIFILANISIHYSFRKIKKVKSHGALVDHEEEKISCPVNYHQKHAILYKISTCIDLRAQKFRLSMFNLFCIIIAAHTDHPPKTQTYLKYYGLAFCKERQNITNSDHKLNG